MDHSYRARWLERFLDWAQSQSDVRAIVLVGSNSREDHPADEWSDFDFVLIASNPSIYLATTDWLLPLGQPLFSLVERAANGETIEHRVLFEDGLDVDIIVLSPASAHQNFPGTFVAEVMQRGRRVLLDKDGLFATWADEVPTRPVTPTPSSSEFLEVVHDFWFHAVWTAKKLSRGELWVATTSTNVYLKRLLLRMIEWHAQMTRGPQVDTWFNGRFIEQWAAATVLRELPKVCARYDVEDVWLALQASQDLFHKIATETAEALQYCYPAGQVEIARQIVRRLKVTSVINQSD